MQSQKERPRKAYLALGLGLGLLGFSAIFVSLANAPGTVVAFYRMAIATLILALPFGLQLRKHMPLPRKGLALAVLAGVFFGADLAAWSSGVVLSGATLPTLFANTNPLWVGLGAWLIFKEELKTGFWFGLILALLGAVLILGADLASRMSPDPGMMLGLLAGLFYGAYFLVAQRGRVHLRALTFFWVGTLSSSLTLLMVNLYLGNALTGYPTETWLNFLAQGLIIQAAGWFLVSYSQGYLPASLVSPTLLGQPVLTAFLAGPLLGERLRSSDLVGGATVLAGIFIIHRSRLVAGKAENPAK